MYVSEASLDIASTVSGLLKRMRFQGDDSLPPRRSAMSLSVVSSSFFRLDEPVSRVSASIRESENTTKLELSALRGISLVSPFVCPVQPTPFSGSLSNP